MFAEIISIGEELLSSESETIDTNSVYITKQLGSIGIRVLYKTTVGDDEQRITDVIGLALSRADVIITSGGLGPTVDDMTRQGVANSVGRGLEFRQDLLDEIAAKFARFNSRMSDNNRIQAMIPEGSTPIDNPVGTAPGFIVEHEGKVILSVPGVPREMKAMMEFTVVPYLKEKLGAAGVIKTRILRTAGIGESLIDEQIGHLEKLANPTVGLNAHAGQTDIRITARTKTDAEADALIATVENEVREKLGQFIFGVDKERLEDVFVSILKKSNLRAAIAEVGTGGELRKRVVSSAGGADVLEVFEGEALEATQRELAAKNISDATEIAEHLAAVMHAQTGVAVSVAVVTDASGIAVGATNGLDARTRAYGYNTTLGGVDWVTGWGLSIGWWLLTQKIKHGA